MHVDSFRRRKERLAPHLGQQFLLGHHLPGMGHQVLEQLELFAGQRNPLPITRDFTRARVQSKGTYRQFVGRITVEASKDSPDAGVELVGAKRFAQVVVGSGVERAHNFAFVDPSGGNDHRNVARGSQHSQHHDAINVGQPKIEDDDVGSAADGKIEAGHGGLGHMDNMARCSERPRPTIADKFVVFDNDNDGHTCGILLWHHGPDMGSRHNACSWNLALACCLLVILGAVGCSDTAPKPVDSGELGTITTRGRLIVGLKFDLPAFSAKDPTTGRIEGFDAEIARLLASSLFGAAAETNVEFVEVVSRDREEAIRTGRVDLVVSTYTITAERQKLVAFAGPYYVAGQDILVRRSTTDITGVDSLRGRKTCSVIGSTSLDNVRRLAPGADLSLTFDRYSLCVEALLDGRIDAVTTDDAILLGFLRENPDRLRLVGRPFTTEPYGIGTKLEATALREWVNAVLGQIYVDGRWKSLYEATIGKAGLLAPQPPQLQP